LMDDFSTKYLNKDGQYQQNRRKQFQIQMEN
jgi:hypothetical protein